MTLEISTETEERLRARAREQGLTVEALLVRLLDAGTELRSNGISAIVRELPTWELGSHGSLRRVDIYEDAR